MKLIVRCLALLAFSALPLSAPAQQNYKPGAVYRVIKLRILPGHSKDFYQALSWGPKVWAAEKDAGLIDDWQLFHSVDFVGAEKYDVLIAIRYKNMAALDTITDKAEPVIAKVYGTPANRAEVGKMREASAETVSSELIRAIDLIAQP